MTIGNTAMIFLGKTIKFLREKLDLSQRAAAEEVGISFVHLNRLETNKVEPSPVVLEKFRKAWGIDLYMLAVCLYAEPGRYPRQFGDAMQQLKEFWEKEIERLIKARQGSEDGARNPEDGLVRRGSPNTGIGTSRNS